MPHFVNATKLNRLEPTKSRKTKVGHWESETLMKYVDRVCFIFASKWKKSVWQHQNWNMSNTKPLVNKGASMGIILPIKMTRRLHQTSWIDHLQNHQTNINQSSPQDGLTATLLVNWPLDLRNGPGRASSSLGFPSRTWPSRWPKVAGCDIWLASCWG